MFVGRKGGEWVRRAVVSIGEDVAGCVSELRAELIRDEPPVLGLDCEWISWEEAPAVSLLQLATKSGFVALFRLCQLEPPAPLAAVLGDASILKTGVGIGEDARRLRAVFGTNVESFLDLRFLYMNAKFEENAEKERLKGFGLAQMAEDLLEVEVNKASQVRCSDWATPVLTEEQISYAAKDAQLSVDIFSVLDIQLRPESSMDWLPSYHAFLGKNFKNKRATRKDNRETGRCSKGINNYNVALLSAPLYENLELLAPDRELLTMIGMSRIRWYLSKDLVDIVDQDEAGNILAVSLKKEPKGRPTGSELYYTGRKLNRCVVCGRAEELLRKHVVPRQYRRHFPCAFKSHCSHDVLLLCLGCHANAGEHDRALSQRLAAEYEASLGQPSIVEDPNVAGVVKAARALLNNSDKLPQPRREELTKRIAHYFQTSVSQKVLEEAAQLKSRSVNLEHVEHGEKVIQRISREPVGIENFQILWRRHFVEKMDPKYLPDMWSLDHKKQQTA